MLRVGRPSDVFGGEVRRRDIFTLLVFHLIARAESGASYGNQLIEQIEAITGGAVSLNPNTMYPLLRGLEGAGFIEGRWEHPEKRSRRLYTLTAEGRAECDRLKQGLEPFLDSIIDSITLIKREIMDGDGRVRASPPDRDGLGARCGRSPPDRLLHLEALARHHGGRLRGAVVGRVDLRLGTLGRRRGGHDSNSLCPHLDRQRCASARTEHTDSAAHRAPGDRARSAGRPGGAEPHRVREATLQRHAGRAGRAAVLDLGRVREHVVLPYRVRLVGDVHGEVRRRQCGLARRCGRKA